MTSLRRACLALSLVLALAPLSAGGPALAQDDDPAGPEALAEPAVAPSNLLLNSQFVSSLGSWAYVNGVFQWAPSDAGGDPRSGSALGSYGGSTLNAGTTLSQCLPVTAGKQYVLTASAFIPAGGPSSATAAVAIFYFSDTGCLNASQAGAVGATSEVGSWRPLVVFATAPAGTKAARPALVISGGTPAQPARVYYDRANFRQGGCAPTSVFHCLNGERFRVFAQWKTADGASGNARTVPFTADSGSFWFFDPSNLELNVKVLDACTLNGRYWVFAAGATNVEVTLGVVDTLTGAARMYTSPQGKLFATVADTNAFATCP
jgi:hypothetical protein